MGCFKEGNTANAVDKAFGTLRIANRIHKTLNFMISQRAGTLSLGNRPGRFIRIRDASLIV